ncbi:MAG TPA: hypothetical protein VE713_10040 [Pyrinomonadaceae bacterium]|nr:hypothetical protein [Pyrinomonadaceae bacterium]
MEGAFVTADIVFVGKVIKITPAKEAMATLLMKESGTLELLKTPRWEKYVEKARRVTLEVSEPFKGVAGKTVELVTAVYDGGGTCGVPFKKGESYLVYAYKRPPSLSENEAKLSKESWSQEIRLKAEVDNFNERLPPFETNTCTRTRHSRWTKKDINEIHRIIQK